MSGVPQTSGDTALALSSYDTRDFVTLKLGGQLFGIPVLQVQDVLNPQRITRIPLAAPEIAGALNLRGRIVTAIDMRTRLGLPATDKARMSIVVEYKNELYSLLVDEVGDVMSLTMKDYENSPATLDARWRDVADGIYRLNDTLMLVLDVAKLLGFTDVVEEE